MRLSEAIRLGAMMKPQSAQAYYNHETGGTCALGAALDAIGVLDIGTEYISYYANTRALIAMWPWVFEGRTGFRPFENGLRPFEKITAMNDVLGRTREQIADWAEEQEKAHDKQLAAVAVSGGEVELAAAGV